MTWSYRIVRHADGSHDVREVHVDTGGAVTGVAGSAADACWYPDWADAGNPDPRASIVRQLERQIADARALPIVDMPVETPDARIPDQPRAGASSSDGGDGMNRVKALAADAALYPVWIAFLILFLIWRLRVRIAASPPASTTDAWLDAADHEHQRRATANGDVR